MPRILHRAKVSATHQRVNFVGQDLVKGVAVVPERDSAVGGDVGHVDVLVDVDDELSLGMDFDEDLLLVHDLHNLADVRASLHLGGGGEQRNLMKLSA